MILKRWEPINDLRRWDVGVDRIWRHMFQPVYIRPQARNFDGYVPIDVYHEGDNLVVKASLPGVDPKDVNVSIADRALTISTESTFENEVKEEDYVRRERRHGSSSRSVALPEGLNLAKAEASYENGELSVTFPASEESKPKTLKVKVKAREGSKG